MVMPDQRRRLASYLLLVVGVVIGYTLLYQWGMAAFEGEQRSFLWSLDVVVETLEGACVAEADTVVAGTDDAMVEFGRLAH